ncbi:MAG: potassium channel protein [Candidatus Zixiibacteriota bacterium]
MKYDAKFRLAIGFGLLIIFVGTIGYSYLENWSILDSLYMTIITLSTVGFMEVRQLTETGRVFTIFLIVFGAFNAAFIITAAVQFVFHGQLELILGKRKMEKKLKKLENHIILCGFGRVGRQIASEFERRKEEFVVVEHDGNMIEEARKQGIYALEGDASADEVLEHAGIGKAKAIVSTLPDDADNVYLALTARQINPDLLIIARAETLLAKKKLRRAGANKVICPHELGGVQMAMATLRPNVVDFLQLATVVPGGERLGIEEITIRKGGVLTGKSIIEAAIKSKYDAIVVGLRKGTGEILFNPPGGTTMEDGDIVIVLGENGNLEKLSADLA